MKLMARAMKDNFWMSKIKKYAPKIKGSVITVRFANRPVLEIDIAVDMKGVYYEVDGDITTIGGIARAVAFVNGEKKVDSKFKISDRTFSNPREEAIALGRLAKGVWNYELDDMSSALMKITEEQHRGTIDFSGRGHVVSLRTTSFVDDAKLIKRFATELKAVLEDSYPGQDVYLTIKPPAQIRGRYVTFVEVVALVDIDGEPARLTWSDIEDMSKMGYRLK
jgi:hypothetical protein